MERIIYMYLQIHGTAMGTKLAVSFSNLFMAAVETEILSESTKPLVWKRYIDVIAQNAWTSLIIHRQRSGNFEYDRVLKMSE